jgi:hypothetical protein
MPFIRKTVEEVFDLLAQFGRPTSGIQSGRSSCRDPHRVIGSPHPGRAMSRNGHGRQSLNGHVDS